MLTDEPRQGILANDPGAGRIVPSLGDDRVTESVPEPASDAPPPKPIVPRRREIATSVRKPTCWDASRFTLILILGAGSIICRDIVVSCILRPGNIGDYNHDLALRQNIDFCCLGLIFAIIGQARTPRNTFSQLMPMLTLFVFLLSTGINATMKGW